VTKNRPLPKIINVASVPQRSPFRYPGGKTWLVPYLRAWLRSLPSSPQLFAEPFVGGGIISLTVGFEQLADEVAMIELDEDVAAVWRVIFGEDSKWLANQIKDFEISIENVRAELSKPVLSMRQRAFNTILKNRTFHGGILAPGAGLLKNGENGKGIKSRWYANTLAERILNISMIRERFTFLQTDGLDFIAKKSNSTTTVFFIDPPYTAGGNGKRAGRRLYTHSELDHERLFDIAATVTGDFLMTYDNDPEVVAMANRRGFDTEVVPMKNTHHAEMVELLIGKDLKWARALLDPTGEPTLFD
jgi:DNA adenine methylase